MGHCISSERSYNTLFPLHKDQIHFRESNYQPLSPIKKSTLIIQTKGMKILRIIKKSFCLNVFILQMREITTQLSCLFVCHESERDCIKRFPLRCSLTSVHMWVCSFSFATKIGEIYSYSSHIPHFLVTPE